MNYTAIVHEPFLNPWRAFSRSPICRIGSLLEGLFPRTVTLKENTERAEQLYNYRIRYRGVHPMGGNEAEIFIIAILGENKFFAILGRKTFFCHFRG